MSSWLRRINLVMGFLFGLSAVLQWNDPDPAAWMLIYGAAALACFGLRHGRAGFWLAVVVGLAAFAWASSLAGPVLPRLAVTDLFRTMHAETPIIEQSRELLGLVIVGSWMAVLASPAARRAAVTDGAQGVSGH